jgi:formylglycine-generating enzyme required for sulfatase activity
LKKAIFRIILIPVIGIFTIQSAFSQVKNEMLRIPGGTFLMGSPETEPGRNSTDEGPQHQVTVSSFLIAKYPVTQPEYEEIMGVNPSHHKGENNPVEQVTWLNAVDYCNKRSIAEGLIPVYTINGNSVTWNREANGYRLPTESEWEYACRAGTQTPYYTGDKLDDAAWYRENTRDPVSLNRSPFPVGLKQPNSFGLYDMHGNVLEWCWDFFGYYTPEAKVNPTGPATGNWRVYRGGCWDYEARTCRSAYRYRQHVNFRFFYNGFRVARSI